MVDDAERVGECPWVKAVLRERRRLEKGEVSMVEDMGFEGGVVGGVGVLRGSDSSRASKRLIKWWTAVVEVGERPRVTRASIRRFCLAKKGISEIQQGLKLNECCCFLFEDRPECKW